MTTERELIDGATAIARGALSAGCTFFAGYPITPASGILTHMLRELPKVGGIGVQAEDEIASMGLCIGAALGGSRAMTASSGPGLSLYSENIGVCIMAEVPLVIVVVQRMGPATGAATTGAQGDVQFMRWGTSGGYPVIALSPSGAAECFHLTRRAFRLAERFRMPVFLATDKEVVMTSETVSSEELASAPPDWPSVPSDPVVAPLVPYGPARSGEPGAEPLLLRYNASSHDERGYITKDPATLDRLNRHLAAKVEERSAELELVTADLDPDAATLVVSFGVTARSAREAAALARADGRRVSCLTVHSLWPAPERAIAEAARGVRRVVVAELNLGQYVREIARLLGASCEVRGVHRMDGLMITPGQILSEVL